MAHIPNYQGVEKWEQSDVRSGTTGEAIAKQRFCVKLSAGTLIKTTADTDTAAGLSWDSYDSGTKGAQYIQRGRLRFIATGNVAVDDPLCPDNATPGNLRVAVSGDRVVGKALTAAETGEYCFGEFDFISTPILA